MTAEARKSLQVPLFPKYCSFLLVSPTWTHHFLPKLEQVWLFRIRYAFCEIRSLHWLTDKDENPDVRPVGNRCTMDYGLWSSWRSKQKLHKLVLIWLWTHWLISDSLGSHSDCSSVEVLLKLPHTLPNLTPQWALVSPDGHTRTHSELRASANAWTQAFKTHTHAGI